MKLPNYKQMSFKELQKYVLSNREDKAAWKEYASRPRPNAVYVAADTPPEEEKRIIQELIA